MSSGRKPNHNINDWQSALTQEQRTENARRAGLASAESRKKYKTFRECMQTILSLEVSDEALRAELEKMGLDPSYSNAISMAAIRKAAAAGDIEAARFTRDTVGEKPTEALNLGITGKPVKALDLSQLSDEELEALADQAD